jgi:hypothetical protein
MGRESTTDSQAAFGAGVESGIFNSMEPTDLPRLRRFALAAGVILLTYAVAAVELDTGETVRPLGTPLLIRSPEWLGIGLALAALYGSLRFFYYGVMVSETPAARRRRSLADAGIGPGLLATRPINVPEEQMDELTRQFQAEFPRAPVTSVTVSLKHIDETARDVQETLEYKPVPQVHCLVVPTRVRTHTFVCRLLHHDA